MRFAIIRALINLEPARPIIDTATRKKLRRITHHLDPVIIIGNHGLTDAVLNEVERALTDHELIKLRINHERSDRAKIANELAERATAEVVQKIGKTLTLYRANPKAKANLSNVQRYT